MKLKHKIDDHAKYYEIPWNLSQIEFNDIVNFLYNTVGYNKLALSQGHMNHDKPFGSLAVSRIYYS